MLSSQPQRILTVSELTGLIRDRLEQSFTDLWVEGEVCNLRAPSSGHLYFGLKDRLSQIRAVLFRASAQRLRFSLRDGLQVVARGRLTVYEPRGEYQAVLEYLEPKGIGALQIAFEQLKEKLAREGLFEAARKRPLPFLPRRVGIVTSLSGAALRDMLSVLRRRCPLLGVVICPVPVQGEGAAVQIAEGIHQLGVSGKVDILIVGRGGGSFEDLWCFNEEVVVRAITNCPIPVVSAVGHEIDFTLADFAADFRAATPSAAAEAVSPVLDDIVQTLKDLWLRQEHGMRRRLAAIQQRVQTQYGVLPTLEMQIQRYAQQLDELGGRLDGSLSGAIRTVKTRIVMATHRLEVLSPLARISRAVVLVPQLVKRLEQRVSGLFALRRQLLRSVAEAMHGLSPLAVLSRGYSIVQTMDGTVIRRAQELSIGEDVRAKLSEGQVVCRVRDVLPDTDA
jgi:exodeoxyribonuclease VII large subunit